MRILIVEPDAARAARLRACFVEAHTVCDILNNGEELERGSLDYDLLVLNSDAEPNTLPRLRAAKVMIPVIAVVGEADQPVAVRLALFDQGADDVLCWPVSCREIVSRAKAIARRYAGHASRTVTIGPLCIDLDGGAATIAGSPLVISRREFAILECLALRVNRIVSKEQLLTHMYQLEDHEPQAKIIDIYICKLRKKIREACPAAAGLIETAWGRGHIMRQPPWPPATSAA